MIHQLLTKPGNLYGEICIHLQRSSVAECDSHKCPQGSNHTAPVKHMQLQLYRDMFMYFHWTLYSRDSVHTGQPNLLSTLYLLFLVTFKAITMQVLHLFLLCIETLKQNAICYNGHFLTSNHECCYEPTKSPLAYF